MGAIHTALYWGYVFIFIFWLQGFCLAPSSFSLSSSLIHTSSFHAELALRFYFLFRPISILL
jgi:hypothetical protein